jgi:hypothetical protein
VNHQASHIAEQVLSIALMKLILNYILHGSNNNANTHYLFLEQNSVQFYVFEQYNIIFF